MPGPPLGRGALWCDSCKRPPPVSDHSVCAFWVVAYGRFDCREKSKSGFDPRTSTRNKPHYSISLDAPQICLAKFLYSYRDDLLKISAKVLPKNSRNPFPVNVHRSKTSLLKLACDWSNVFRALRRLHAFPLCFMAYMIGCIKC